jgi:hypothetical protein
MKISFKREQIIYCVEEYQRNDFREAVYENGVVIKYRKDEYDKEKEWIFLPSIGWNNLLVDVIDEIKSCNCMWNYYGKVVTDENYADPETGWRDNFFIMKSDGQWQYRMEPGTFIFEGYWDPVKPQVPKKKFSLFGGMKVYANEKKNWTNECDIMKRYNERKP